MHENRKSFFGKESECYDLWGNILITFMNKGKIYGNF